MSSAPPTTSLLLTSTVAVLLSVLLTTTSAVRVKDSYGWFKPTDLIWNTSSTFYFNEIEVFLNATRLSYVSTSGGYFENWTVNESISPSWVRSQSFFLNPEYGLRAMVFYQPDTARLLIVFRGTDLTNDIGGICDRCADSYLWDNIPYSQLPSECQQFSEATLDYLANAESFVGDVAINFIGYDFMYTGHSLGAGLAAAVSTLGNTWGGCGPANAGAIVFSPPGYIETLMRRTSMDLSQVDPYLVVSLADHYDPVWVGCNASKRGGVLAQVCQWFDGLPSSQCVTCDANPSELPVNSTNCQVCMMQRHEFAHYYSQLRYLSPICQPSARQECEDGGCTSEGWFCSSHR